MENPDMVLADEAPGLGFAGVSEPAGRVAICMATYNGARFVSQQIDSILSQTYSDWVLFVRDDGSADDTCAIVDSYVLEYPDKIVRIIDEDEMHDCSLNFLAALRFAFRDPSFDFFMFCDQDDVWNSDKIEIELAECRRMTAVCDDRPLLVITDCSVVDEELNVIREHLTDIRTFDPRSITLAQTMVNNIGQGATMLMSRELAREILENFPDTSLWMHDWWAMALAMSVGEVSYLHQPTLLYRQHGSNTVGASNYDRSALDGILHVFKEPEILKGWVERLVGDERGCVDRANSLYKCVGQRVLPDDALVLQRIAGLNKIGALHRLRYVRKYALLRQNTLYEKLYQIMSIVLAARERD